MSEGEGIRLGVRWVPLVMLLVLGAVWGGNPAFSKALVTDGLSPAAVVFWQTFIAGLLLSVVCVVKGIRVPLSRRAITYYCVIGLVGIDVAYITLVFVVRHVPAGYASVVVLLSPVLTYIFAIIVRLEGINLVRAIGIVVGFIGAGLLVFPQGSLPSPELLPIALIAFITPAGYALANVYSEWGRPVKADNVALATATMFAAAAGAAIVSLIDGTFHPIWVEPAARELILVAYAVATATAFILFYQIVARAGSVYLGQVGYLVTLFGVGWGVLFFDEKTTVWLWIAILVVGAGVAMVNLGKRKIRATVESEPDPDAA